MRLDTPIRGRVRSRLRAALLLSLAPFAGVAATAGGTAFKLHLEDPGVYRVTYEELAAAGLTGEAAPSSGLGLSSGGRPVPIWVEDGGDGTFGPGDWIELIGEHLAGEGSYLNEYTRFNVYNLRFDQERPARMAVHAGEAAPGTDAHATRRRQHLERDLVILRLPGTDDGEPAELWYWAKLVHGRREPYTVELDLGDLAVDDDGAVELRLGLRGWSDPRAKADPEISDHSIRVSIDGTQVAAAEWNGTQPYLLEVTDLSAHRLVQGGNTLELEIPERPGGENGKALVDVVMLNWIEITYPHDATVGERQARFELADPEAPKAVHLRGRPDRPLYVYGTNGSRTDLAAPSGQAAAYADYRLLPAAGETAFFATHSEDLLSPDGIVLDRPSNLMAADNRADYILVAHRKLLDAALPLAELHRSRGLEVAVVDVEDVYDEFRHGIAHPEALRSFLEHAYRHWTPPVPRFVLLVGDASWDGKNALAVDENYADWTYRPWESESFAKNKSTTYEEDAHLNHRNLIPTFNHATSQGHSASDNHFVAFDGDYLPAMAIGRLPVVEPSEVTQIVDKTIRYVTRPEVGPWRRNALFITNESGSFQRQSDRIAGGIAAAGFVPHKVYPASSETSNEQHSAHLVESFNDGQLFVHFLGHGGRYIWRTGPPDLKKNHDLFTLDHLDQLEPTGRLPVVLSLTCYSAPFDHPSADSIGEKLLRIDHRGAVAVFAASWRNSPSSRWGEALFDELTRPDATIGEAVTRAKRTIRNRMFVETYNLLGDPAVPVALPAGGIALEASLEDGALSVRGVVDLPDFSGAAMVDLVGNAGETLSTETLELPGRELTARLEPTPELLAAVKTVRAYAWNRPRGIDAVGAVDLPRTPAPVAAAGAAGGDR